MTRKRIIIIFCMLVVAVVLRELVFPHFNFYRSRADSFYSNNFSTTHLGPDTTQAGALTDSRGGFLFHGLPRDVPVRVRYGSYERGDPGEARHLTIDISHLSTDIFLWTPLYKSSGFSANTTADASSWAVYLQDGQPVNKASHLSGTISITGHITIVGLCSYTHARELIVGEVLDNVYTEVKKQVSTW